MAAADGSNSEWPWADGSARIRRIPLNLFGIPFGLTGLAGLWTAAADALELPAAVPSLFWGVAVVAWLVTLTRYVAGVRSWGVLVEDLKHPVFGPFAALAPIVATILGERAFVIAPAVGRTWVVVTATVSFVFATWFVSHLASGGLEIDQLHAGYLLPTVAAGLITSQALASVGFDLLALGAFAVGMLFWVLLGAVILYRIGFRPQPPAQLLPTRAIFSAPPAVAGNAWFVISADGGEPRIDTLQEMLFGLFLLLIALQVFLVRTYLSVPFGLGFWAVTFTAAASGRYAVELISAGAVPIARVWEWGTALLATGVILLVAVASVRYVIRTRRAVGVTA